MTTAQIANEYDYREKKGKWADPMQQSAPIVQVMDRDGEPTAEGGSALMLGQEAVVAGAAAGAAGAAGGWLGRGWFGKSTVAGVTPAPAAEDFGVTLAVPASPGHGEGKPLTDQKLPPVPGPTGPGPQPGAGVPPAPDTLATQGYGFDTLLTPLNPLSYVPTELPLNPLAYVPSVKTMVDPLGLGYTDVWWDVQRDEEPKEPDPPPAWMVALGWA